MEKIHLNVFLNLDGSLEDADHRHALYLYAEARNNYIDAVANKAPMREELKQYHAMIRHLKNLFSDGDGDFISYWDSELKDRLRGLVNKFIRDTYPGSYEKTEVGKLKNEVAELNEKLKNAEERIEHLRVTN